MTHVISFSVRSASLFSYSSPSAPHGVGVVSSRTSAASSPCVRKARRVAGAVSTDAGSATIDACELGCTISPAHASPAAVDGPPSRIGAPELEAAGATAATAEGIRRELRRKAVLRRTLMSESGNDVSRWNEVGLGREE